MRAILVLVVMSLLVADSFICAAGVPINTESFDVEGASSMILGLDNSTLFVAIPAKAKLLLFDTFERRSAGEIEVDCKPWQIAIQGNHLYMTAQGTSRVHVLNLKSRQAETPIQVESKEPLRTVVCHRQRGLLYVANQSGEIFSIDPIQRKSFKTSAVGSMLTIDPSSGDFVYAATNLPAKDVVEVVRSGNIAQLRRVTLIERASVRKYEIKGKALAEVDRNVNAAIGYGGSLSISPDGKQVWLAAGGGWRSIENSQQAHYVIAVFDSKKMSNMLGQVDTGAFPTGLEMHPVLRRAVASKADGSVKYLKSGSLIEIAEWNFALERRHANVHRLLFCAKGSGLAYLFGEKLFLAPLELDQNELTSLIRANGKLPPSVMTTDEAESTTVAPEDRVRLGKNARGVSLIPMKHDVTYCSDMSLKITEHPKELDEAVLLERSRSGIGRWLITYPNWFEAKRKTTIYVAVGKIVLDRPFSTGRPEPWKLLQDDGWVRVKGNFMTTDRGSQKFSWTVLRKEFPRGSLDLNRHPKPQVQAPQFIFMFKQAGQQQPGK
jgi:hypothetical protein